MSTLNLGPWSIPIGPLLLLAAYFSATTVAKWQAKSSHFELERLLWRILIGGIVVARAAFVIQYFDLYQKEPWRMLDIRDGGFAVFPGMFAVAVLAIWFVMRRQQIRRPLLLSIVAGSLVWATGATITSGPSAGSLPIPELTLSGLDGAPVALRSFAGKPVVINLWASWCPPCRREMPALQDAQKRHQDIVFVFANQGESGDTVRAFLKSQGLALDNVLLDPPMQLGGSTGSSAFPTTLFFNAQGILVERRAGELSSASLAHKIEALREVTTTSDR